MARQDTPQNLVVSGPDRPIDLCVFGAAPGSGNHGVTALWQSLLDGLYRRARGARITVFDNERGIRRGHFRLGDDTIPFRRCGAVPTRRLHRPESLGHARIAGLVGATGNPVISCLREADAVLDASGGDSFSDLYGMRRFRAIALEKQLALRQRRPLILLPQTIGPFAHSAARRRAARICEQAAMVWARDRASYEALQDLLGHAFDPDRHRSGVDLAFGLPSRPPKGPLPDPLATWIEQREPFVAVNVSGLLWNAPDEARARYGLTIDYRATITGLVRRLLDDGARVLLVPHVFTHSGHFEHDPDACRNTIAACTPHDKAPLMVLPVGFDPAETKWFIARSEWCCATRMHVGIAGLSSGVPTAAIAYSPKTRGVFERCGQEEHVADGRRAQTNDALDRLWDSYVSRSGARAYLQRFLPSVLDGCERQLDAIIERCAARSPGLQPQRAA